jgi:hypothetical protein
MYYQNLGFSSSTNFKIEVEGELDNNLSENFGSLSISHKTNGDNTISCLKGEIIDQAELIGILNTLYNMRFSIISVIKQ